MGTSVMESTIKIKLKKRIGGRDSKHDIQSSIVGFKNEEWRL